MSENNNNNNNQRNNNYSSYHANRDHHSQRRDDRNGHFNKGHGFNRDNHHFNNQNRERRFEDVTFKDKSDDEIVKILLDKQKKIGRNLFGSDIHPLYELIIRQNKRIKVLEEKLNLVNKSEKEESTNNSI